MHLDFGLVDSSGLQLTALAAADFQPAAQRREFLLLPRTTGRFPQQVIRALNRSNVLESNVKFVEAGGRVLVRHQAEWWVGLATTDCPTAQRTYNVMLRRGGREDHVHVSEDAADTACRYSLFRTFAVREE